MKKNYFLIMLSLAVYFLCSQSVSFCQQNKQMQIDSALENHSEKWKVKENNKMFGGIHKPEFGPYITTFAEKLDSPVIKKRTRNGAELELKIGDDAEMETGNQVDLDMSKKVTIQKTKFYRLQLSNGADTTESLFSIFSTVVEKKQTLIGKVLSKKEEEVEVLSYNSKINGIINTHTDSLSWNFFYTSGKSENTTTFNTDTSQNNPEISGYLKNNFDSLYIEPIVYLFKSKLYSFRTTPGFVLVNKKKERLAALQFATQNSKYYIWIRNDINKDYIQAISSLLALIIAI